MKGLNKFPEEYFLKYKTKPVTLKPYNLQQEQIAEIYIKKIGKVLKDYNIRLKIRGSTAFKIMGKGEVEVGVYPNDKEWNKVVDKLKSVSAGYASISYKIGDMRDAVVARLDMFVAEELVPAFTKIVSKKRIEEEARISVEKLYKILPRQMFAAKIQAKALGRIISSKTLSALKKDVTGYLYGGDITRKMKLREKQKKGKKKMQLHGAVNVPHEVFLKMMKSG